MVAISLIPSSEFRRITESLPDSLRLPLIADMCRLNTLSAVKKAGSGHLGSSFSSLDIVVWLYYRQLNLRSEGIESANRDIYFSSKGHDVPGLYSVLHSIGVLEDQQLLSLRRLNGLDGHPNLRIRGIEANTGSLGMGISKGKGMALGKKAGGRRGDVFVMTGDGELQEGQIWEALQTCASQKIDNLTVIVDHNKVQSDSFVENIISLGDLEGKLKNFGWQVSRCDGHDFSSIESAFHRFNAAGGQPRILIADTIKGKGVSFMEHPSGMQNGGLYRWHSGAPDDESYQAACRELKTRIAGRLSSLGLGSITYREFQGRKTSPAKTGESVAEAFGRRLVEIGRENPRLLVLDADLAADCRLRDFEKNFPDRFIENGIAEQDMVSMAGGLAKEGFIPVVNSFASFLASRANEQIYNNSSEGRKIIYACHYAGMIPAGPGLSHQSVRDISLLGSLPNLLVLQPANSREAEMIADFCINQSVESSMIRLVIGPSPGTIKLPPGYSLEPGRGAVLTEGNDAVILSSGPVMLHQALEACGLLEKAGLGLKVVNMPWLNIVDQGWLARVTTGIRHIFTLDDHLLRGGLGDSILDGLNSCGLLSGRRFRKFGLAVYPEWGDPEEVLRYHGLDAESLKNSILKDVGRETGE